MTPTGATPSAKPNCAICFYARPVTGPGPARITCCRHAPQPLTGDANTSVSGSWPVVLNGDWCGEYKAAAGAVGKP